MEKPKKSKGVRLSPFPVGQLNEAGFLRMQGEAVFSQALGKYLHYSLGIAFVVKQ